MAILKVWDTGIDGHTAKVDFDESTLRPFAMYRDQEDLRDRPVYADKLGQRADTFSTARANPEGVLEAEADFFAPRTSGTAAKARNQT